MKKFVSVLLITIVLSLTVLADPPPPVPPGNIPIGGRCAPAPQTQTSASVDATSIVKGFWDFLRAIL